MSNKNNTFFFNADDKTYIYKEPEKKEENSNSIFYNPSIISDNKKLVSNQNSKDLIEKINNNELVVENPTNISESTDVPVVESVTEISKTTDESVVESITDISKSTNISVVDSISEEVEQPVNDNDYIVFSHVSKSYLNGEIYVQALKDASFSIDKGEMVIILGNSGAGKSTALNLLGGMDQATSGNIMVDGVDITKFNLDELTDYRREDIGFVFQFYNLIQNLTVKENILLASEISKENLDIEALLDRVGLKNRIDNFPSQLSGGEQQRVSIVRALIKKPKILLCDEPTGALDYKTSKEVLKLLQDISREQDITVIIITHNNDISAMADKIIRFKSGEIIGIETQKPMDVEDIEW